MENKVVVIRKAGYRNWVIEQKEGEKIIRTYGSTSRAKAMNSIFYGLPNVEIFYVVIPSDSKVTTDNKV